MTRPAASLLTTLLASLLTSLMASLLVTSLGWRGVRPQGEDDSEQTKEPMRYDEDGRWVFDYDNALPEYDSELDPAPADSETERPSAPLNATTPPRPAGLTVDDYQLRYVTLRETCRSVCRQCGLVVPQITAMEETVIAANRDANASANANAKAKP